MIYDGIVKGKYVCLRSIEEKDAPRILEMRADYEYTKYLGPPLDSDVEHEEAWIRSLRDKSDDYTFVSIDSEGKIVGKIALMDIADGNACSGRFLMYGNALQSIETSYLMKVFAFDILKLEYIRAYIDPRNKRALRLSEMEGMTFSNPEFVPE